MSRKTTVKILNGIDPALAEECAVYCPPSERNGMKKQHSRRLAVIVLAACLVVALAVTAYATGAIQSLISKYWSSFHYVTPDDQLREERPDYAQWLDTQLETQAMMLSIGEQAVQTEVPYQIPGLEGAGVTLLEYYYDGEKIALACQFHAPEQQVDFRFDAKDYANLPFQTVESDGYPSYRGIVKDVSALQNIEERLQKDSSVSFLAFDAWISDHVHVNGEDLGPCHGDPDENGFFTVDPIAMGMGEVELPEKCRNLPEVSVSLTYRVVTYAFRLEGDTVQYARVGQADYPVTFTIPNLNPDSIPEKWSLGELTAGETLDITQQIRGTNLTIHAVVPEANTETLSTVRMRADTALWKKMGRELVMERFPQIEGALSGGETDISVCDEATGNLLLGFDCSADGMAGYLYYVDVPRDLNGSNLDGDGNWFTSHYITSTVPEGMDMTGEEAAQKAARLLENYSCFRFSPWNVQAEYDRQKQQGYYRITLQPEYQGLPVYGSRTASEAFLSNDGLFCCQGLMMLRESRRMAVRDSLPLERAIESFVNHISELAAYDTVRCSEIRLGYLAQAQGEEVVLSPAWVFECTKASDSHSLPFLFAVMTEDGTIWTD